MKMDIKEKSQRMVLGTEVLPGPEGTSTLPLILVNSFGSQLTTHLSKEDHSNLSGHFGSPLGPPNRYSV